MHEGPHGISSWQRPYKGGFRPRMTTSNEVCFGARIGLCVAMHACHSPLSSPLTPGQPGYYEDGNFGIRIESVHVSQAVQLHHRAVVVNHGVAHLTRVSSVPQCAEDGPMNGFLTFENLTPVRPLSHPMHPAFLFKQRLTTWVCVCVYMVLSSGAYPNQACGHGAAEC